jgi:Domain of unknown function (DUF1707)
MTAPPRLRVGRLVCGDSNLALTISDVATRQTAGTRAKDSDRNCTCQILDTALFDGQLSMAEHGERVKAATNAATLGELRSLIGDLQTANAPVTSPSRLWAQPELKKPQRMEGGGGWGMRAAVAGVLVALGIGIGWGLYGNTSSPLEFTSDPGAKPDGVAPVELTPPRELHSVGGLTGLLESIDPANDPTAPGALSVEVYVSSDYGSGYIELDGAGNVKQINYPNAS